MQSILHGELLLTKHKEWLLELGRKRNRCSKIYRHAFVQNHDTLKPLKLMNEKLENIEALSKDIQEKNSEKKDFL